MTDIIKSIDQGTVAPLYYLSGENVGRVEDVIERLKQKLFGGREDDFNLGLFDAQVHGPPDIIQMARTVPFGAARRLVVVKRAHAWKDSQWQSFEDYFSKPSAQSCLVFAAEKQVLKGGRLKLFKKNGVTASFANPRWERDIKKTVNEMLQRQGMRMAPDALSCFVETVGGNTGLIANELEKLSLYCAGQKTVTRDAVVQVLADGHTATIFNLVDSIGMGRRADALRYVNLLCGEGVHALVIIKMAARQLRMLVRALEGLQRRDKPAVIGKQLGLKSEFVVQGILKQARGWSGPGLARAFDALCQADGSVKSSRIGHAIILENLILTLMRLRNQPAA